MRKRDMLFLEGIHSITQGENPHNIRTHEVESSQWVARWELRKHVDQERGISSIDSTMRTVIRGTLDSLAMRRLVETDLVTSRTEDQLDIIEITSEVAGKSGRPDMEYYRLTDLGKAAIQELI